LTKNPIQFDIQLSDEQKEAKRQILETPVTFLLGAEGTGKTLLSTQVALDLFFRKEVEQIVVTRPAVAAEDLGFMPGGISEKLDPYLQPIYQNFNKVYGNTEAKKNKIKKHIEAGEIKIIPVAFTRGITYDNAVVIVDEMQNLTNSQFQMIIGRLGRNSKLIFTGSDVQIDLKKPSDSAIHLLDRIKENEYVSICRLTSNHRHPAVASILGAIRR
jgi:phosphate starvation-inducible PhoH-like protein